MSITEYLEAIKARLLSDPVAVYSYHWEDQGGQLVLRWDNAPHRPNLTGCHDANAQALTGTLR